MLLLREFVGLLVHCVEVGVVQTNEVAEHIGDERGIDNIAALVCNGHPASYVGAAGPDGHQCRGEEQKRDATIDIEIDDFRKDRERRVVDDHAVFGVVEAFVVAARVEGPNDGAARNAETLLRPCTYRVVDGRRSEAVVGGLWRFFDEFSAGCIFLCHNVCGFNYCLYLCGKKMVEENGHKGHGPVVSAFCHLFLWMLAGD